MLRESLAASKKLLEMQALIQPTRAAQEAAAIRAENAETRLGEVSSGMTALEAKFGKLKAREAALHRDLEKEREKTAAAHKGGQGSLVQESLANKLEASMGVLEAERAKAKLLREENAALKRDLGAAQVDPGAPQGKGPTVCDHTVSEADLIAAVDGMLKDAMTQAFARLANKLQAAGEEVPTKAVVKLARRIIKETTKQTLLKTPHVVSAALGATKQVVAVPETAESPVKLEVESSNEPTEDRRDKFVPFPMGSGAKADVDE
jgi:hypothetical protein